MKATYEPTDEECEWKADDEQELTVSMQVNAAYRPPRTDLDRSQHQVLLSSMSAASPGFQLLLLGGKIVPREGGHKRSVAFAGPHRERLFKYFDQA